MTSDRRGLAGARGLRWFAIVAALAAAVLLVVVYRAQVSEPAVHDLGRLHAAHDSRASAGAPRDPRSGSTRGGSAPSTHSEPVPLGPSRPTTLTIPAIGVHTPVNALGLDADGTLAVPQPGPHLNEAAWFENSPTPGQPGPSIIEGHVDSVEGPSVFLKLGDIRPGDLVMVDRADGRRLTFRVDAVRDFLKASFPTRLVYGGGDLSTPSLRLITCSDFDPSIEHHVGNEVVFAHLVKATASS